MSRVDWRERFVCILLEGLTHKAGFSILPMPNESEGSDRHTARAIVEFADLLAEELEKMPR